MPQTPRQRENPNMIRLRLDYFARFVMFALIAGLLGFSSPADAGILCVTGPNWGCKLVPQPGSHTINPRPAPAPIAAPMYGRHPHAGHPMARRPMNGYPPGQMVPYRHPTTGYAYRFNPGGVPMQTVPVGRPAPRMHARYPEGPGYRYLGNGVHMNWKPY